MTFKNFRKRMKLVVEAISLGNSQDRINIGIRDHDTPVYRVGMKVVDDNKHSYDANFFTFMPDHITTILAKHPRVGDVYFITFEGDKVDE